MALFGSKTASMSFVTRRVEYASAIAAPPTMKIWPRTPLSVSSLPSASSALRIFARAKYRSGTVEDLPCDEHAMACHHRRRVRERVRMELRPACHEPPRLDEATSAVHPWGGREYALRREQLRHASQRSVEARVSRRHRLVPKERDPARAR